MDTNYWYMDLYRPESEDGSGYWQPDGELIIVWSEKEQEEKITMTSWPWVPSPGSPLLWLHGRCSGQQSFHSCGCRRISQCSGLQVKERKLVRHPNVTYKYNLILNFNFSASTLQALHRSGPLPPFHSSTQTPLTLWEDGSLSCELFQHLGSSGQSVSALTHTDVQAELADAELSHGIRLLLTLVL